MMNELGSMPVVTLWDLGIILQMAPEDIVILTLRLQENNSEGSRLPADPLSKILHVSFQTIERGSS
jgi:hypothetical protein